MEDVFGSSPEIKIISYMLAHPKEALDKTHIIRGSKVGRVTFYTKLPRLVEKGIITSIGQGRRALYQLNEENPIIKALLKLKLEGNL